MARSSKPGRVCIEGREARARRDYAGCGTAGGVDYVKATARVPAGADRKGAHLYVALADNGLASDVKAGENAGVRLTHDHVVRLFRAGPAVDANGDAKWDVVLPVPSEAGSGTTIVAFIQNAAAGDVLQALALPLTTACAASR